MTQAYNKLAGSGSYEWWVIKEDATGDYLSEIYVYENAWGMTTVHLKDAATWHTVEAAEKYLKRLGDGWFIRRVELEVSEYNK